MELFGKLVGFGVVSILMITVTALIAGIPVYLLWNWVVPDIFGLPVISFLQAIGLSLLCSLFFKSSSSSSD